MNQINGYCQIELPDRITLDALTSNSTDLTDAEAKPIIKALNLDQVTTDAGGYTSFDNAWLGKPLLVLAYPYEDALIEGDKKAIYHANIKSMIHISEVVHIMFTHYDSDKNLRIITIEIQMGGSEVGEPTSWRISISAKQITTTAIS